MPANKIAGLDGGKKPPPDRLPSRPWMTAAATRAVIAALQAAGGAGSARFVGGCVRDTLLQRDGETLDIDIATTLTPQAASRALQAAGLAVHPTGIEHGTVTAVADHRPFEITTLRRDVETDGRRAVVAFTTDWAEDSARRDFRLNALYAEPDGRLHDPTGGGIDDALAGRVVFVGDPEQRIREDYLRILRFFRFRAWYGRGEADAAALDACKALRDGVAKLSAERVSKELLKLLAAPDPRPSVRLMASRGILETVLPEAEALDRFEALVDLAPDPLLRLSALLPDDLAAVAAVATRLRLSNAQRQRLLAALPGTPPVSLGMSARAARAAIYRLGAATFCDRLIRAAAEAPDNAAPITPLRTLAAEWTPPRFPLGGAEAIATGATGPEVGRLLRAVEDWWIANDFPETGMAERLAGLAKAQSR